MNLLARSTDYAVRALIYMASRNGAQVSTVDFGRDLGLPRPFMRKTLQRLQKEGFLTSVKGYQGGFTLAVRPEEIRLIDLVTIFQGGLSLGDCLFKKEVCSCVRTCPLRREIKGIESAMVKKLNRITIAQLMKQ